MEKNDSQITTQQATVKAINNPKSEAGKNKKKPFILRFFKGIFITLFVLLFLIAVWFSFCIFDKTTSLKSLPRDYSIYLRTDNIWEGINPMLDLKAADILLANEPFVQFRQTFLTLRESNLRNNFFVSYALSRRVDGALYENNSFIAIVDMGLLAGVSRLAPLASKFISIPDFVYVVNGKNSCFEYRTQEEIFYIKPYKNLIIATNQKDLLIKSVNQDNEASYTFQELKLLTQALNQPFRIAADGKKLIGLLEEENPYIQAITTALSTKELSEIQFGVTDENINITVKIPFEIAEELKDNSVVKLLQKDSQIPVLLSNLPESVQYYTFVTAGSLSDLKEAAFTVLADKPDLPKKWQEANNVSKMVFKETLEEILFSWTSDEYAVLGIEGKAEPVFAIKISDEIKRQYIFDTILSSIVFKTDNSLLLDGIRMPRIEFPSFLQSLLEAFGINLPKPYYMVKDGFVYFSQSPENLACVNAAIKSSAKLSKNENWIKVSEKQNPQSSLSLFYDLERSIPFFIKKQSMISDILQLYNIGRVDVMTKEDTIYLTLQASALQTKSTKYIPGFPISLEKKVVPVLHKSNNDKNKMLYWQEDKFVKAINTSTLEIKSKEINNLFAIIQTSEETSKKEMQEIWAITKEGNVYLLNANLEIQEHFPIVTSEKPFSEPAVFNNNLIYFGENGILIEITPQGQILTQTIDVMNDIKTPPVVCDDVIAAYEKGFLGIIHLISQENQQELYVNGIGFGSPCLTKINNELFTAFITQAGEFYLWNKENQIVENFPVQLPGIFYQNVKAGEDYFAALSSDGTVYKIQLDGKVTGVKIPYLSAKTGYLTLEDYNNDEKVEIFVCGEGNTIYGFNSDMEYLNGFPVSGYGQPAFMDVNGDKLWDCLTLTIDNKINAWKVN